MKVVEIFPSNYRDIPATLRIIADELESGELPEAQFCGIVMLGVDGVEIFGLGRDMDPTALFMLGIQHHTEMLKRGIENGD